MDDFFDFSKLLSPAEQDIRTRVRDFLRAEVEPIANEYWARAEFPFQLIDGFRKLDIAGQDHLATMLGNVTSSLALVVRLAQLQDEGVTKDEHSALAKSVVTLRMRETVGLAREVLGGNGILLENNVARGRSTS